MLDLDAASEDSKSVGLQIPCSGQVEGLCGILYLLRPSMGPQKHIIIRSERKYHAPS